MTKKGKFLQKMNEAFAKSDTEYILQNVTDDIKWTVIGDQQIQGKDEFARALKEMEAEEPFEIDIHNIITHGDSAAVDGIMKSVTGKSYSFCDVYKFRGFKNPLIKEMTSYVIETS
ncbi:nuclear transport factor 2 family protein [Aliifodinibius sp. S!AR15-10]|uniref:nuclear transport factor 2 family protein n=1 Tax=Aliifodinibius sp. S!AR15-10 TaxID=2950437 RepID=UPI002865B6A9|nr:nuclear transport factor 2 family protein [Aliifodinibius sp. S!AR15-10]MDR8393739.1 nuclear transport factor 2 family protein [Aliifodinibius sp. S!AR15-10]